MEADRAEDRRQVLDVIPPDPPSEPEVLAQGDEAGPTEAEEARAIREHRQALAGMKDRLLEEDRRAAEVHKAEEARKLKVTIEEKRADFLRELNRTLKERGSTAGPEIVALCARYGRSIPKDSEAQAHRIFSGRSASRLPPKTKVEALRNLGWPESVILELLAKDLTGSIGTRNGPKDRGETLTSAAKILLAVPLQRPTASLGPQASPRRPMR
ncbi:MAG: hypothetical protein U0800_23415 [Isosphaeraceae bacterium]